ncbi:MAG: hypothetical protein IJ852_03045 [Alphaproteobacteria bacterium]|nr:hypothetical protein [Alphaproteobacteria bacterium]
MYKKILYAFAALLLSGIFSPAEAGKFVEGMEDMPLPDYMTQITQDDVSFGNEETRLIEAYVTARKVKFEKVAAYYQESLPQLGWVYQGNRGHNLLFDRDGETLEIVREAISPLVVRITLKTKP